MKKIILALLISIIYTSVSAQVKFEAQTERSSYGLNERIQLVFSINNEGDNFVPPKFPGFKAEGPFINKGNQTSITIINGKVTQKREISTQVIYYLTPTKKGTFTIGAASIEYNETVYKSAPIKITITDPIQMPSYPGQQNNANFGEGIHLVAEMSTKNPYVNEPVTVIYKLYFEPRSTVGNFRNFKAPKYNDFWSQYIDMKQLTAERGKYNGKDYSMVVLRKVILYPLEAGAKTIEPFKIDLDAEVPTGRRDWFGEYEMRVIQKSLSTGMQTINVKPLPENGKPAGFTGAVGKFDFVVKPSKTALKAGESLDLEVSVSGKGNLKLFTLPKPVVPSALEMFEPAHTENVQTPVTGMTGKISDKYTIIPQFKGKYTIKPMEFSYYDLASKSYKTITSKEITIDVAEGDGTFVANTPSTNKQAIQKKEVFQFNKLKTEFISASRKDFLGSGLFYSLLFAPLLLIPIVMIARKQKEAKDADVVGNRVRNNNRLVKKYLSEAKKQMGDKVPFYMAMEKALHNFLKAKLHIETVEMSKDNIIELLQQRNASEQSISQFMELMNDCEFARYAPATDIAMTNDFERAVERISELEKQLK
ncbi:BatD family protein [Flavobacterium lacisediminis]|uniref:BatD family protein n=1 Tax=Flavobacterium lacisediminis TaxID=2989705 RepID=A0ABT3EEK2_9FLAO|nr:BatD family protein [Flavobacterium lacisediminis]MCW1146995.1 BatD family protein [Flavobacterium lacisediminis]